MEFCQQKVGTLITGMCLSTEGVPAPRGVPAFREGCLVGGAWSGGRGSAPGGVPAPGGACLGGLMETPGRLLLRAVRILLECILIYLSEQNPIIDQV